MRFHSVEQRPLGLRGHTRHISCTWQARIDPSRPHLHRPHRPATVHIRKPESHTVCTDCIVLGKSRLGHVMVPGSAWPRHTQHAVHVQASGAFILQIHKYPGIHRDRASTTAEPPTHMNDGACAVDPHTHTFQRSSAYKHRQTPLSYASTPLLRESLTLNRRSIVGRCSTRLH